MGKAPSRIDQSLGMKEIFDGMTGPDKIARTKLVFFVEGTESKKEAGHFVSESLFFFLVFLSKTHLSLPDFGEVPNFFGDFSRFFPSSFSHGVFANIGSGAVPGRIPGGRFREVPGQVPIHGLRGRIGKRRARRFSLLALLPNCCWG